MFCSSWKLHSLFCLEKTCSLATLVLPQHWANWLDLTYVNPSSEGTMPCVLEFTPPSSLIKPPSLLMENCQFTSSYRGLSNQALKKHWQVNLLCTGVSRERTPLQFYMLRFWRPMRDSPHNGVVTSHLSLTFADLGGKMEVLKTALRSFQPLSPSFSFY